MSVVELSQDLKPELVFSAKTWKQFKPDVEDAFLAAVISNFDLVSGYQNITPQHFFQPAAKAVWHRIQTVDKAGLRADTFMLMDYFKTLGEEQDYGKEIEYIYKLIETTALGCNVSMYADELNRMYIRRRLVMLSATMQQQAENPNADIFDVCQTMIDGIQLLVNEDKKSKLPRQYTAVGTEMIENTKAKKAGTNPPSIQSDFPSLDAITGGVEGGQLITVGARPSIGKSTFALNIANNIAKQGHPTLFISLETTPLRMMEKIISRETKILQRSITTGNGIYDDQIAQLERAVATTSNIPFYFDDDAVYNAGDVERKIDQIQRIAKAPIKVVVIDYLQLMISDDGNNNANAALSKITRGLKLLAMKLKITIIVLSQLSRKVEEQNNKRPMLSHLRDSGSIEQDSDCVWMLYRDDYYNPDSMNPRTMEVFVLKNRDGATGKTMLDFTPELSTLSTMRDKQRV
jgi:replicative DNA helicase